MDNINTLLVAFMFITILTLGIAGVLAELAEVVRHAGRVRKDGILVGWAALLLFVYFHLFWHTSDITLVDEWDFRLFLFAETGPVLLLFATQILLGALTDQDGPADAAVRQGRFFVIFAALQIWSVAAGYVLGVGFTMASALDLVVLLASLVLAFAKTRRIHSAGLVVVALVYIVRAFLELRA